MVTTRTEEEERTAALNLPAPIIGPATIAYPRNEGWHLASRTPRTNKNKPRKLSDLTIHNITEYLTGLVTRAKDG